MSVASVEALIAGALMDAPFQDTPSPYVVSRLAEHVGSAGMWQELAERPYLLDTLDPDSVASAALRTAYGRTTLPGSIAASLSARHLLKRLNPPDRLMTRWIAAACGRPELGDGAPAWAHIGDREPAHVALIGHVGPVLSLAVMSTEDGVAVASSGIDETVRIWDPVTGRPGRERIRANGVVTTIASLTTGGGRLLAGATSGGGVRIWHWPTGEQVDAQPGDGSAGAGLLAALPQPDGRELLCTGVDRGRLRFWSVASDGALTFVASLLPPTPVRMIAPLPRPGGRTALVTAGYDGSVQLWDAPFAGPGGSLRYDGVERVAGIEDADGARFLLIADHDRLDLFPVTADGPVGARWFGLTRTRPGPICATLVAGLLAAADRDGLVRLWRTEEPETTRRPVAVMAGHTGGVLAMAGLSLTDGRTMLVTGGADGTVRLWHPAPDRTDRPAPAGRVTSCAALRIGPSEILTTGSDQGRIQSWDQDTGRPGPGPSFEQPGVIYAMAATELANGETVLATAGPRAGLRIRNLQTGATVSDKRTRHLGTVHALTTLRAADDRPLIASAGADRTVRLWDAATGRSAGDPLRGHRASITQLAVLRSADGPDLLVSAGLETVLRLWRPDGADGYTAREIDVASEVRTIAAIGRSLLAGCRDGEVRLIDGDDPGEPVTVAAGGEPASMAIADGSDGPLIVVGTAAGEIQFWSLRSGRCLRTTLLPLGQRPQAVVVIGRRLVVRTDRGFLGCAIDPRLFADHQPRGFSAQGGRSPGV